MRPVGTAFFVSVSLDDTGRFAPLLVTALHVLGNARTLAGGDGRLYIRVNNRSGGTSVLGIEDHLWVTPAQSPLAVDLAVCAWPHGGDYTAVRAEGRLTEEIIRREAVGMGDDLLFTGMFVGHCGAERNLPIARVGHIALMPGEPVATKLGPMEAYLIEARSAGGFSGSPVFVRLGATGAGAKGELGYPLVGASWYLLGVVHGHWEAQGQGVDAAAAEDRGRSEDLNMGIAIVTPIGKLQSMLEDPGICESPSAPGGRSQPLEESA
jgi:hypothetical protein